MIKDGTKIMAALLAASLVLGGSTKADNTASFGLVSSTMIGFVMHSHILAKAVLKVTYGR
jgi:hypothetical protein